MIIASVISLVLGILLLESYNSSVVTGYYIYYASLIGGIMNLIAFPIELISGAFLLRGKFASLGTFFTVAVLVIGLASPLILGLEGYLLETGMLFGLPMIAFSAIALGIVILSRNQSKKRHNC